MQIFYIDMEKYILDKDFLKTFLKDRTFANLKKEQEHCYGRFLIHTVAKGFFKLESSELDIKNKKPYFKYSPLQFNLTHSENIVLVAFDKNPVGVDLEIMKERNFEDIFKRYNMKGIKPTKELFYKFWTEFEAKIKLQGTPKTTISTPFLEKFMLAVAGDFDKEYEIYELTSDGKIVLR